MKDAVWIGFGVSLLLPLIAWAGIAIYNERYVAAILPILGLVFVAASIGKSLSLFALRRRLRD